MSQLKSEDVVLTRKRKLTEESNTAAIKESIKELKMIKGHRNTSPTTKELLDMMLQEFQYLENLDKYSGEYLSQQKGIIRLEPFLCAKLQKDSQYYTQLQNFRELVANNICLRYGDYYKHNLFPLNVELRKLAKDKERLDARGCLGKNWKELLCLIEKEAKILPIYLSNGLTDRTQTPTINVIEDIAGLVGMSFKDAVFQISQYAKRNDIAHSSIDVAIEKGSFVKVAEFIIRDRRALEGGILPSELEVFKPAMLSALQLFQDKFFKSISIDKNLETAEQSVGAYELSEAFLEKKKLSQEAEAKSAAAELKSNECQLIYEESKSSTSIDPNLIEAREELHEAITERDQLHKLLKEKQGLFSKAELELRRKAMKMKKILCGKK